MQSFRVLGIGTCASRNGGHGLAVAKVLHERGYETRPGVDHTAITVHQITTHNLNAT